MRKLKVLLMGDDALLSGQIPALKWIAFETRIDDGLYFLRDGRWFVVAQEYESQMPSEAARILGSKSTLVLPAWPNRVDERDYNQMIAAQDNRYLALDRAGWMSSDHVSADHRHPTKVNCTDNAAAGPAVRHGSCRRASSSRGCGTGHRWT